MEELDCFSRAEWKNLIASVTLFYLVEEFSYSCCLFVPVVTGISIVRLYLSTFFLSFHSLSFLLISEHHSSLSTADPVHNSQVAKFKHRWYVIDAQTTRQDVETDWQTGWRSIHRGVDDRPSLTMDLWHWMARALHCIFKALLPTVASAHCSSWSCCRLHSNFFCVFCNMTMWNAALVAVLSFTSLICTMCIYICILYIYISIYVRIFIVHIFRLRMACTEPTACEQFVQPTCTPWRVSFFHLSWS